MPKNFNKDLTQGNVSKQLIKFSIPFLISNLLQASYAITDMIIVGQFCGRDAITGVAIGGQVTILVSAFIIGFGIAGTILVSQYAGAKNFEEQRKTIGTVIILFFILSAILTAVMLFAGKSILILLKTPGSAMDAAYSYQQICMGGLIFIFGYNGICGVLRGMGDSVSPLYFVAFATALNVILDLIIIGKLGIGVKGAAIATVIAQGLCFIAAIIFLIKSGFFKGYTKAHFKLDKIKAKLIIKLGLPSSLQQVAISMSFLFLTALVNMLPDGVTAAACLGIASKVNTLGVLPAMAVGAAIAAMAGQNIGGRDIERAKKTTRTGFLLCLAVSAPVFIVVQLFPSQILRAFTPDKDLIDFGLRYMRIIAFDYLFVSGVFSVNHLAIGAGHTRFSLINGLISSIALRIPLAYFFGYVLNWGFNGIGLAVITATAGASIVGFIYYKSGKWQKEVIKQELRV